MGGHMKRILPVDELARDERFARIKIEDVIFDPRNATGRGSGTAGRGAFRVEEDEVAKYQGEINASLGFVEQLGEVNVEGVEAMTSVTPMQLRRREDKVTDGGYPDKVVANAPVTEDHLFLVPKVVE